MHSKTDKGESGLIIPIFFPWHVHLVHSLTSQLHGPKSEQRNTNGP